MSRRPNKKPWGKPAKRKWRSRDKLELAVSPDTKRGILIVLLFAFSLVAILSYFNIAGPLGEKIIWALRLIFGWAAYIVPLILLGLGYALLRREKYQLTILNYIALFFLVFSFSGLLHLSVNVNDAVKELSAGKGGGYFGFLLSFPLQKILGFWATLIVQLAILIIALLVTLNLHLGAIVAKLKELRDKLKEKRLSQQAAEEVLPPSEPFDKKELTAVTAVKTEGVKSWFKRQAPTTKTEERQPPLINLPKKGVRKKVDLPIELLDDNHSRPTSGNIEGNKEKIKKALQNFGIEVEMGNVNVGPTVTQYTLRPADGVKLAHISTLQNDLALALAAHPIRVEAPIPGKSLVGLEVPNLAVADVALKDILTSKAFLQRRSNLAVCLGKDVSGNAWVANLESMPHLLIAGATGSGKSVCLHSLIISLLYQNNSDDLKFIMVDPKRVEFTQYNGIPHLLAPVITDVARTVNAFKWAINEMERRYNLLSQTNCRSIQNYNEIAEEQMPYIVILVDELADLMAAAPREVEAAIIRLAQMARAVGIHLVIATQRPSVDVITGLIKANITCRIAFAVASLVDSRTILDSSGAEKLLGRGDMLYISPQLSKPKRLQGVKTTDVEIDRLTKYLREHGQPEYQESVTAKQTVKLPTIGRGGLSTDEDDPLMAEAKEVIIQAGKASASLLQRRLRIGYARAARLLDLLEAEGIIGPGDGAKPREILTAEVTQNYFPAVSETDTGTNQGEAITKPAAMPESEDLGEEEEYK